MGTVLGTVRGTVAALRAEELLAATPRCVADLGGVRAVRLSCVTVGSGCVTVIAREPPTRAFPLGYRLVFAREGIEDFRLLVPTVGSVVTVACSLVPACGSDVQGVGDAVCIEAQLSGPFDDVRRVRVTLAPLLVPTLIRHGRQPTAPEVAEA